MKSLLKRITGDQSPADGDATGFSQAVANSVHSLLHRWTGPVMPSRDEAVIDTSQHPSGSSPEDNAKTAALKQSELHSSGASTRLPNDEPPAAILQPFTNPRDRFKSPYTAPRQRREQNARRNSLDPLQRYFSPRSHSFPDYGHISPDGNMAPGAYFRVFNASFGPRPVNTMSSKTQTVPSSSRASTDRLSAKRQKTDDSGNFTTSKFAPIEDLDQVPSNRMSRTEQTGSQSITSVDEKTWDTGIKEYRAVEGIHDPHRRPRGTRGRSRPSRGRLMHLDASMDDKDPIQDLSDESSTSHVKPRSSADAADIVILGIGSKSSRLPAKQDFAHTMNRNKKRLKQADMNGEIDELADDSEYSSSHPYKKLNTGNKGPQQGKSSSISTRGDLKPSLSADAKTAPLEGNSLPLKVAVWKPSHIYDASESSADKKDPESVVLSSREVDNTRAIFALLRATPPHDVPPKYAWFQIQSWKIQRVRINYDRGFVKIVLPSTIDVNLGAILYLQFHSTEDTHKFSSWLRRYSNVILEPAPDDGIAREFEKAYADIKKRPTPRATRPAATHSVGEASKDTGSREVPVTGSRPQQSGRRLIDKLEPSSGVRSGTYGYNISDDDSLEESRPRRALRSQRNPSSPPSIPILDRWTEVNPEWDKDWRLPLTFHRTMVDKDDIPRLDEGQCLNDNIIGFYLKYLQIQAEKQRPETSKRIYFHNSFFYSKLKPSTGRHINYDGVKNWTAKVDIFAYDYIVVPVNEHFHWWVAIICNPGKLDSTVAQNVADSPDAVEEIEEVLATDAPSLSPQDNGDVAVQERRDLVLGDDNLPEISNESNTKTAVSGQGRDGAVTVNDDAVPARGKRGRKTSRRSFGAPQRKYNPADPRIITLDSLGASHSPVCGHLKQYLIAEFKDKKGKDVEYEKPSIGMRATNIPEQDNFCDCGVYLLKYVAEFLSDPDKFIQGILQRENRQWDFNASEMRNEIRQLIFDLHGPYQQEQEEAKRHKALAKRKRERSKSEAPVDGSALWVPVSPGDGAVSPQKAVDSALPSSHRTPPAADRQALPQGIVTGRAAVEKSEHSTTSPQAEGSGPSETAQYDTRAFHVVDDHESTNQTARVSPPQSMQSLVRPSQTLPSIEIADDDDAPAVLTQRSKLSSRQASLGAGRLPLENPEDKVVEVRSGGLDTSHGYNRSTSETLTTFAASVQRRPHERPADDSAGKKSAKSSSLPRPESTTNRASASSSTPPPQNSGTHAGLKQNSNKSPHFGSAWRPSPAPKVKTYSRVRKTHNGGQMIDLTDE